MQYRSIRLWSVSFISGRSRGNLHRVGGTRLADYGSAVKCHTVVNADGSTAVMYSVWNGTQLSLYVDSFSDSGSKLSHKSVPLPGKSWGGTVYRAPDGCYYVLTGNSNGYRVLCLQIQCGLETAGRGVHQQKGCLHLLGI